MYEMVREIKDEINFGSIEKSQIMFVDYVADWLERRRLHIEHTTYDGYLYYLNNHIKSYFEPMNLEITEVLPLHIEKYSNDKMLNDNLSPNSVRKHIAIMRTAMDDAYRNGLVQKNTVALAIKPKCEKHVADYYNIEQMRKLLQYVKGHKMELPVYFAVFYGLRRNEVLGMRWSAIDFENGLLYVKSSVVRVKVNETDKIDNPKNKKYMDIEKDRLKTEKSIDVYPLNGWHYDYLKSVKEKQEKMLRNTDEYMNMV